MENKKFIIQLITITIVCASSLLLLQQWPRIAPYQSLAWLSLSFFGLGAIPLFFLGKRAAIHENKHYFSNFFMAATALKMLLSLLFLGVYWFIYRPEDNVFILYFFTTYVFYTAFEVYFLSLLAKSKSYQENEKLPWE